METFDVKGAEAEQKKLIQIGLEKHVTLRTMSQVIERHPVCDFESFKELDQTKKYFSRL